MEGGIVAGWPLPPSLLRLLIRMGGAGGDNAPGTGRGGLRSRAWTATGAWAVNALAAAVAAPRLSLQAMMLALRAICAMAASPLSGFGSTLMLHVVSVVANGNALTSNKGCSDKLMSYTN